MEPGACGGGDGEGLQGAPVGGEHGRLVGLGVRHDPAVGGGVQLEAVIVVNVVRGTDLPGLRVDDVSLLRDRVEEPP